MLATSVGGEAQAHLKAVSGKVGSSRPQVVTSKRSADGCKPRNWSTETIGDLPYAMMRLTAAPVRAFSSAQQEWPVKTVHEMSTS